MYIYDHFLDMGNVLRGVGINICLCFKSGKIKNKI